MQAERSRTNGCGADLPAIAPALEIRSNRRHGKRRLDCLDVAQNRAARYARRHRIARPLWPLIATFILVALLFERSQVPEGVRLPKKSDKLSGNRETIQDVALGGLLVADEGGDVTGGWPEPKNRPPSGFLAKDVGQAIAFLIRNRGRLDNEVIRAKWKIVDEFSLPLAIYLRDIEARGEWDNLEIEISAASPGAPEGSVGAIPKSPRHRKIRRLATDWSVLGKELLSADVASAPPTNPLFQPGGDDPDGDNAWRP
ncbi:hypothetical protein SAMN05518861_112153 [Mesorhizobium sp. YR577]|nr:hypothetical protein SAMN05518861_112153 [Mesorhizobium sp. YR577]